MASQGPSMTNASMQAPPAYQPQSTLNRGGGGSSPPDSDISKLGETCITLAAGAIAGVVGFGLFRLYKTHGLSGIKDEFKRSEGVV